MVLVCWGAKPKVKGLSPSEIRNLEFDEKEFKCRDSSKVIPFSQVNDNYCDCQDGSDEPGTPACPNGKFWCRNIGFVGNEIFSTQVWDGVCDCCDGSDEKVKCKNTCFEKAAIAKAQHEKDVAVQLEGVNKRKELVSQVKQEIADKQQQLVTLKEEKLKLEEEKRRAEEEQKRLQEEAKLNEEARLKELEAQKAQEAAEAPKQEQENVQSVEGLGKWENAEEEVAPEKKAEELAQQVRTVVEPVDDSVKAEEDDWDEAIDEMKPYSDDSVSGLILSFPARVFSWASDCLFGHQEVFEEPVREEKVASEAVTQAENALRENERKIKEIEDLLENDFGEENVFYYMHGKTYSVDTAEYTYELRPFDGVTQKPRSGSSGTSLGTWDASKQTDSWKVSHKEMFYSDGVKCWGGPDRSTRVSLLCGSETRVAEPNEPNKCEYTLKLYTPAVCDEQGLKGMKLNFVESGQEDIV